MSKYVVKVGVDFDPTNQIKVDVREVTVTVEMSASTEKKEEIKTVSFKDWKVIAVIAVVAMIFSTGAYAAISNNYSLFDKVVAAVVQVANHSHGEK